MDADKRGFSLIELLVVMAVLAVLTGIAIHHILAARAAANEASAIGTLRAVNSGQFGYSGVCGRGAYAPSMTRLLSGRFVSQDLALSPKSGYLFSLTGGTGGPGPVDCLGETTQTTYYLTGQPENAASGQRGFSTNSGGTIWQDLSGVPPVEPFTATGSVSPIR